MRKEAAYLLVTEQAKSNHSVMFTAPDSFAKDHSLYAGQWGRLSSLFLVVFFSSYRKRCNNNKESHDNVLLHSPTNNFYFPQCIYEENTESITQLTPHSSQELK